MKIILSLAIIATFFFLLLTSGTRFPLIADDTIFAAKSYEPHFNLMSFHLILVKRPLTTLINFITFKFQLFNGIHILITFYFFLHAIGLISISLWLWKSIFKDRSWMSKNPPLRQWAPFAIALCLYPCLHEIQYIALSLPYSLGTLFIAGMLWIGKQWPEEFWRKRYFLKTLLMFSAFASFESYILPALLIPLIPFAIQFSFKPFAQHRKDITRHILSWTVALTLFLGLQGILSQTVTAAPYGVQFSLGHIFTHAMLCFKILWTLHFYKEYWFFSLLEWLAIALAILWIPTERRLHIRITAVLFLFPLLASAHAFLISYYAPRAIHGSAVLKLALMGCLFYSFSKLSKWPIKAFTLTLLLTAYLGQSALIFSMKTKNTEVLIQKETLWAEKLRNCPQPCTLSIGNLEDGLMNEWALPSFCYESFVRLVQYRNGISGQFNFTP